MIAKISPGVLSEFAAQQPATRQRLRTAVGAFAWISDGNDAVNSTSTGYQPDHRLTGARRWHRRSIPSARPLEMISDSMFGLQALARNSGAGEQGRSGSPGTISPAGRIAPFSALRVLSQHLGSIAFLAYLGRNRRDHTVPVWQAMATGGRDRYPISRI